MAWRCPPVNPGIRLSTVHNSVTIQDIFMQGLTNPLPGRPGQVKNRSGQSLFPTLTPGRTSEKNIYIVNFSKVSGMRGFKTAEQVKKYFTCPVDKWDFFLFVSPCSCNFIGICVRSGRHVAHKNDCSPFLSFQVMSL